MEEIRNVCPGCGRHCDLSEPHCERGRIFAESGAMPERPRDGEVREHIHRHEHEHDHGPRGSEGDIPRHPGGPHGPDDHRPPHPHHPPHPPRPPRPPFGGESVTETELYAGLDTDGKILALLRELGRAGHLGPDGRGGQGRVLHILSKAGTMSQRDLTEKLGIQPGSASEILSKLEAAGHITRSQSESDRRSVDIRLTEAGAARAAEHDPRAYERSLLSVLDASERDTLLPLLEKLSIGAAKRRRDWGENG